MSAAARRYWSQLVEGGCIITGRPAEIAHCHGGSVRDYLQEPKAKGKKPARLDWLVLPLAPELHRLGDQDGIALDLSVAAWEAKYGTQKHHLDCLAIRFGLDLWTLARTPPARRSHRLVKVVPRVLYG